MLNFAGGQILKALACERLPGEGSLFYFELFPYV